MMPIDDVTTLTSSALSKSMTFYDDEATMRLIRWLICNLQQPVTLYVCKLEEIVENFPKQFEKL